VAAPSDQTVPSHSTCRPRANESTPPKSTTRPGMSRRHRVIEAAGGIDAGVFSTSFYVPSHVSSRDLNRRSPKHAADESYAPVRVAEAGDSSQRLLGDRRFNL